MGAVKHLNLGQIKEVVGSVVSGAKDMMEKGTAETEGLVESSKSLVKNNPVGDAVKGLFESYFKKDGLGILLLFPFASPVIHKISSRFCSTSNLALIEFDG